MAFRIDVDLSNRFGVVEKTIFRLVLNGFTNAKDIADALTIFSNAVVGNGIKNLVNSQMLSVDFKDNSLSVAEPLVALLDKCNDKWFSADIPDDLLNTTEDGVIPILNNQLGYRIKETLISELIPEINVDYYASYLNVYIVEYER